MKETRTQKTMEQLLNRDELNLHLKDIKHTILVFSGKGGVGKSTVSVNLAATIADKGFKVGLLDIDIHGPSVPKMLGVEGKKLDVRDGMIIPLEARKNLKVVSLGLLMDDNSAAVIWRGPRKMGAIKQFITDVDWGELDYLVVDSPPGTGDEPLTICQLIPHADGAIIITTPQDVSIIDVEKAITFCSRMNMRVLGVVENMSGFTCPNCGEVFDIMKSGGGGKMADRMGVPYLGNIPIDAEIVSLCDAGKTCVEGRNDTNTFKSFKDIIESLLDGIEDGSSSKVITNQGGYCMKIAIPLANGSLSMHFGHCEEFALIEVDESSKNIKNKSILTAPPHQPGLLPKWLYERGANVIIAGGMGSRAQDLFAENNIKVVVGASVGTPEDIVSAYLNGTLTTGGNLCDH